MGESVMPKSGYRVIVRFASGVQVVLWLPRAEDALDAARGAQRLLRSNDDDRVASVEAEQVDS